MKIDKNITELICELEYKIGSQTYNPNSYNGWTGEEGCSYKYPVSYCKSKKDLEKEILEKSKQMIEVIEPECLNTMKYAFGSNHLYIGDGLVAVLEYLEERYGIDFNKLEEKRYQKRLKLMSERREILDKGEEILLEAEKYIVGIDIPEGNYTIKNIHKNGVRYMDIYAHEIGEEISLIIIENQANIVFEKNCIMDIHSECKIRKNI